ncbi:MAG: oligosaccharide flippase family protein [Actinomycetaceae bacterium]|nr:oligosaccharide flippase family protein [Actinomycetaceae bacterium]
MLTVIAMGVAGLVRLVYSAVVGRSFGPTVLGSVNELIAVATFCTLFVSPGLGQAISKEISYCASEPDDQKKEALLWYGEKLHTSLLLLCSVAAFFYCIFSNSFLISFLVFGVTLTYGIYSYRKAILYGVQKVQLYAISELLAGIFLIISTLVFSFSGFPSLLTLPFVLGYGLFAVFSYRARVHRAYYPIGKQKKRLAYFAFFTAIGTASSTGLLYLAMAVGAATLNSRSAGIVSAALTLTTPLFLIPRAVSVVIFPAMARAIGTDNISAVANQFRLSFKVLCSAGTVAIIGMTLLAPEIMRLVYGPRFGGLELEFALLLVGTWAGIISVPAVNYLSVKQGFAYTIPTFASLLGLVVALCIWLGWQSPLALCGGYCVAKLIQGGIPMCLVELSSLNDRLGLTLLLTCTTCVCASIVVLQNTSLPMRMFAIAVGMTMTALVLRYGKGSR